MTQEKKRGRPKVEEPMKFRTVAVPMDVYHMIRELSRREDRTIARQLAALIRSAYDQSSATSV